MINIFSGVRQYFNFLLQISEYPLFKIIIYVIVLIKLLEWIDDILTKLKNNY